MESFLAACIAVSGSSGRVPVVGARQPEEH
jgi:hypothetical protein